MDMDKIAGSNQTPWKMAFQVGETMANKGVPVIMAPANSYGVKLPSTTAGIDQIGLTLDSATAATAQNADGSDNAAGVSVCVNPDLVIKARLSGGATTGTELTEGTEDTGSTTGLLVSTNVDYSSVGFDEGCLVCTQGANKRVVRAITSLSGADAVPSVAFPRDTAVGDKFIVLPYKASSINTPAQFKGLVTCLSGLQRVQLTSNFLEVDASVAPDTDNANFVPLEIVLPQDGDFTRKMFLLMMQFDHVLGGGPQ